jgi:uncharacterized protein YbjT (DUF2867 family)
VTGAEGRARVLVTGGTGKTGGQIARRLIELGSSVRLASRRPRAGLEAEHVPFDWDDATTFAPAISGATSVYLVAPQASPDPERVMVPFIRLAREHGVRRFVLLSSSAIPAGAPGLGAVERALRDEVPEWAVLKPSWFMQNFFDPVHQHGRSLAERGELVTSTASGRVAFVDVGDVAEVGTRALADPRSHDTAHVITGPRALSYADVAELLARVTGRSIRHVHVDDEEAVRRATESGIPEAYAQLLVGLDAAIREGAEDRVTDTVLRVTGRPPRDLAEVAAQALAASAR